MRVNAGEVDEQDGQSGECAHFTGQPSRAGGELSPPLIAAMHRPQPCLQPPVVRFGRVVRVPLSSMQGRGNQLIEDPRAGRGAAGRCLGRDRAGAQRAGGEAPGGAPVTPGRQRHIDDLPVLVNRPVEIGPMPGDLDIGLTGEPAGAWRQGRATSMNSGVNRCTHR